MKKDRIAVALLGAGRIGQEHAKNLAALPQVEVVVVCDPRIESAEAVRPLVRAKDVTPSPEEAVNRKDVDAVIICTPTDTHAALIEAAAETGKAVFCEKPVALDLTRTQQALATVAEKGVAFQIGFQRRFDSGYAEAKRRIEAGVLGRLGQFRAGGRDPAPPPKEDLPQSGGVVFFQNTYRLYIVGVLFVGGCESELLGR